MPELKTRLKNRLAYAVKLGIPEENFDYDRLVQEEFSPASPKRESFSGFLPFSTAEGRF